MRSSAPEAFLPSLKQEIGLNCGGKEERHEPEVDRIRAGDDHWIGTCTGHRTTTEPAILGRVHQAESGL